MKRSALVLTAALVTLLGIVTRTSSQEAKPTFTRDQLLTAAREIISTTRYAALITLDSSGRTQARTVDPFAPDENFVIWIGTNPRTRKVAAIRRNPHVTLYYFDQESQAYVTIHGTARLVNDPETKRKWFKDDWKAFYPDRIKDFTLIKVTPERLEVVSVRKNILGEPHTWKPPAVIFRKLRNAKLKK